MNVQPRYPEGNLSLSLSLSLPPYLSLTRSYL
jgi:hypothetical protein